MILGFDGDTPRTPGWAYRIDRFMSTPRSSISRSNGSPSFGAITSNPQPLIGWECMRGEFVHEIRWFTQRDLASMDVRIAPATLPALIAALIEGGPGPIAVDAGL